MYLKNELYELIKTDECVFDFIQEGSLDGLWYWDLKNLDNIWMNARFWTTLGYNPDLMPHKSSSWKDIIHPDDLKIATDNFTRHCQDPGHPYDQIVRYTHKDSSTVWIRCRGIAIRDKNGKPVRMLGAHQNVTEFKKTEYVLEKNLKFQKIISDISTNFIKTSGESFDDDINDMLSGLGNHFNVDRSYLFLFSDDLSTMTNTFEWCSEDVVPQMESIQNMPTGSLPWWKSQILSNDFVHIPDIDTLPNEALAEKAEFRKQKIKSLICMRIKSASKVWGFFGFDSVKKFNKWNENEINNLTVTANLIGSLLLRLHNTEMLLEAKRMVEESESKFRQISENTGEVFWLRNADNTEMVYINPAYEKVWGRTCQSLYENPQSFIDSVFDADKPVVYAEFEKYMKYGIFDLEYRIVRPDGDIRWVHAKTFQIRNGANEITGHTGIARDITQSRRAQEALRTELEKNRILLKNGGDGAHVLDLNGNVVEANDAFCTMLGYNRSELIGMNVSEWDAGIEGQDLIPIIRGHFEGQVRVEFETVHERKDHSQFEVEISGMPVVLDGVPYVFYSSRDITERNLANQEIRKFKIMSDNAVEGKTIADLNGNLVYINKFLSEIHGYTQEELVGKHLSVFHTAQQLEAVGETLDELFKRGYFEPRDIWHVHRDGTEFPMLMSGTIINDNSGKPKYITATATDITERKAAEQELKEAKAELENRTAQLEHSNKELEAFSYSVSHDLRAPLRHINGYVDMLNQRFRDELPEKARHFLDTVSGASRKLGNLIDDLLQYSRTGRQELKKTEVDMNLPVLEVMEELKSDTNGRKINWKIEKLPIVFADYTLIRQVWANLLGNAVKYTCKKETAEIQVDCKEVENEFVFCVSDNGAGFDMKYAHKLFGVFQRLHTEAEFNGTGIGLANVQRIVHRHQGRVWAEAEPEKGAKFYFTITKYLEENYD
jgi:PAS domain S-box-containing protein